MPNVYTRFNKPNREASPSGTDYLQNYQEEINDGVKTLIPTTQTNVFNMIQIDQPNVQIENILQRAAMGDMSALNARQGTYCDATTMPKNLMQAQNLVIKMKNEFDLMPTEIKEKFGNSADKYVELMGTEEFKNIMSPFNEEIAKIAEEKNHKEYLKKVNEGAQLNYDIKKATEALEANTAK